MLIAENLELDSFSNQVKPPDDSLPCRGFAVHLLVPTCCKKSSNVLPLLDGMAALSDGKTAEGKPLTTLMRFSVFAEHSSLPLQRLLSNECFDKRGADTISVVLRWVERDEASSRVRTELSALRWCLLTQQQTTEYLQSEIVAIAAKFGATLPGSFFLPVKPATPCFYEKQIAAAAAEFAEFMFKEDEFEITDAMREVGCTRLVPVPGVCVRMSPIALGLSGVTANTAFHALLLCADGEEKAAREFALRHREGLPPPRDSFAETAMLHTLAVQSEHLFLNSAVSLYGSSGKPGEPHSNRRLEPHILPFRLLTCAGALFVGMLLLRLRVSRRSHPISWQLDLEVEHRHCASGSSDAQFLRDDMWACQPRAAKAQPPSLREQSLQTRDAVVPPSFRQRKLPQV